MKTPQRQKKYSYLLLELLIAFFLLSLFLGPLIDSPFSYLRKQKKEITSIYLHLEAEKQLAFIEEKLRNHTISWKQVLESANKEILLEIKPFTIPSHKAQREAHLILSMGSFQIKKEDLLGTVKATVAVYNKSLKGKKEYQESATFFVLKTRKIPDPPKEAL